MSPRPIYLVGEEFENHVRGKGVEYFILQKPEYFIKSSLVLKELTVVGKKWARASTTMF